MIRIATFATIGLCVLGIVSTAGATEYVYEDFESGVSGWVADGASTITTTGWCGGGFGDTARVESTASAGDIWAGPSLSVTGGPAGNITGSGSDQLQWFSADFRHQGGYPPIPSDAGLNTSGAFWADSVTGKGIAIMFEAGRWDTGGIIDTVNVSVTRFDGWTSAGFDWENAPITLGSTGDQVGIIGGINAATNDHWAAHRISAKFDWIQDDLNIYIDGTQYASIDTDDSWAAYSKFDTIGVINKQRYPDGLMVDNIYGGEVNNPHNDPVIVGGDANRDGKVTLADLTIFATIFGQGGWASWCDGDFNWDYSVTLSDLTILATNFGSDTTGGGVPEPATFALLALGSMGMLRKRR